MGWPVKRGGLAAAGAAALVLGPAAPAPAQRLTECQHPVRTGVEVYRLKGVGSATACRVALALYAWEARPGNETRLFRCTSHPGLPILKLHRFDGWSLSIARAGDFVMSRPRRSFSVTGTDFPLNCS